jgi:hypothetical protein
VPECLSRCERPYISHPFHYAISSCLFPLLSLMPPDTFSPSLPITPTESWTQDSTLDDVQQEQSEGPEGVIVFEKKWIATDTEDGDDSASYFLSSSCSSPETPPSGEFSSRYAADVHLPLSLKRCYRGLPVPGWHRRQKWHLLRPQHRFQFGDDRRYVSYPPSPVNTGSPDLTTYPYPIICFTSPSSYRMGR